MQGRGELDARGPKRWHSEESQEPDCTERLAEQTRKGSVEDAQRLYERTIPALFAWIQTRAHRSLRGFVEPEDVIQEVWLRALTSITDYDPARGSFRAWIIGIAKWVLLDHLRSSSKRERRRLGPEGSAVLDQCADSITTISRAVARDDSTRRFLEHVETLESCDRMILVHHGFEEMPLREVGVRLELSEEAVTKRWQRLCARLRDRGIGRDLVSWD